MVTAERDRASLAADYTLGVLLGNAWGTPEVRRKVFYRVGDAVVPTEAALCFASSGVFGECYGTHASLPDLPLQQVEGVPLLFGEPVVERQHGCLIVHADIVASTYFLVTRYEEMVRREVRDQHGRFPGRESLPYRAGFIHRPIVEEYTALLWKWLREVGVDVPEPKRRFSVVPTHDVDCLRKYTRPLQPFRAVASALLGRQPLRDIPESLAVSLGLRKDPFDTFDELIALDASVNHGAVPGGSQSVYFFMAGGNGRFDGSYDVRSRTARRTLRKVVESGANIGLHTSYEAGKRPELIAQEKATLEEVCGFPIRRNRHHYLACREIADGWAMAKVGIDWDSSLGYADVAGFRLGVCHPIPLFDPIKMEPFGIEEHPLIVMDCTLTRPDYMALDEAAALAHCHHLLAETRRHNGEFVFLLHNTSGASSLSSRDRRLHRTLVAGAAS